MRGSLLSGSFLKNKKAKVPIHLSNFHGILMLYQDYNPVFIFRDIKDETIIQTQLTGSSYVLPKSLRSEADADRI